MGIRHSRTAVVLGILLIILGDPATAQPHLADGHELEGYASWYAGKFQGRITASGEVFDTNELAAAHKTLSFGTVVEVTHIANGKSVQVRINDRGPFVAGRIIDLSRAAAEQIAMTSEGIAAVRLEIVKRPPPPTYRIQVAAFTSLEYAERKLEHLRSHGVRSEIESSGLISRVVVPGLEKQEADAVLARLAALGYDDALLRTE